MGCKNGMEGPRYIATSCKSGRYGGEVFIYIKLRVSLISVRIASFHSKTRNQKRLKQ